MTQDKSPPWQNDLFSKSPVDGRGAKTRVKHDDDLVADLDLDELVDTLIEAPEFARARQITEALGIDPDAGPGVEVDGSEMASAVLPRGQQQPVRDVEDTVKAVDFDLADLLARASDELEQREANRADDDGATVQQAPPAGDDAAIRVGFAAEGFDPDPAQLESFRPPPRPKVATGPRLAVVSGTVVDSEAVPVPARVRPTEKAAAPTRAEQPAVVSPVPAEAKRSRSPSRAGVVDAPAAGSSARPAAAQPSHQEIDELWQETSRLQRRFAAAQDLRDSLGRGMAAVPTPTSASPPLSPHPRFAERDRRLGTVQWRRRLVSWLAAALVAAAIIAAGRLGVFDPARAWLHQQLGWTPSTEVDGGSGGG
jgi:hypothetical protein